MSERKKVRRPYSRTGLNALKARVKIRGLHAIDKRTAAAQSLIAWQKALIRDLGGEKAITAQQRALVERAARMKLYLDHLDACLMEMPTLVNRRSRSVWPVVREMRDLLREAAGELVEADRQIGLLGRSDGLVGNIRDILGEEEKL